MLSGTSFCFLRYLPSWSVLLGCEANGVGRRANVTVLAFPFTAACKIKVGPLLQMLQKCSVNRESITHQVR